MTCFGFVPHGLHAKLAFVKRAVNAKFDGERFSRQIGLSGKFAGALRQNVK